MTQPAKIVLRIDQTLKLAAKGDLEAVKQVLAGDPSMLNAMSDGHHRTLLWEAANGNRMNVVAYLVGAGADVNIPGRYRSETFVLLTPYCIARKRKRHQVAEFLLEHGTEIDIYSAAFLGDLDALARWTSDSDDLVNAPHPSDSAWQTLPIHYAVAGEQIDAVAHLVDVGTDVRTHSELLFDIAARLGRLDVIKQLESRGGDPSQTPVFAAVYKGDPGIMAYLFEKGVDVNTKDKVTGWPPVAYVSRGDKGEHPEKVKMLIEYGADVNAAGPKGLTALHAASKAGFVSVIEILLAASADIDAKTNANETPLKLARKAKRHEAQALLEEHGATA